MFLLILLRFSPKFNLMNRTARERINVVTQILKKGMLIIFIFFFTIDEEKCYEHLRFTYKTKRH